MNIKSKQDLLNSTCPSLTDDSKAINDDEISQLLGYLENWAISNDNKIISKGIKFKDYYQTIAFVNAVAWVIHQEDHHPDMQVSYNQCHLHYTTHSETGLSLKDFICAAKLDELIDQPG